MKGGTVVVLYFQICTTKQKTRGFDVTTIVKSFLAETGRGAGSMLA